MWLSIDTCVFKIYKLNNTLRGWFQKISPFLHKLCLLAICKLDMNTKCYIFVKHCWDLVKSFHLMYNTYSKTNWVSTLQAKIKIFKIHPSKVGHLGKYLIGKPISRIWPKYCVLYVAYICGFLLIHVYLRYKNEIIR